MSQLLLLFQFLKLSLTLKSSILALNQDSSFFLGYFMLKNLNDAIFLGFLTFSMLYLIFSQSLFFYLLLRRSWYLWSTFVW